MKFWLFIKLAGKNLLRFRRRTLPVGLTLVICGAVLVFTDSLGNGIEQQLLRNLVFLQTGHLTLSPSGDPQAAAEAGGRQAPPPALLNFLSRRPDLTFHPRLETAVMIQAGGQTITRAFLIGLEPLGESGSLAPLLPVRAGSPLQTLASASLLLSEEYARRLKVSPGDPVTLSVHTPHQGLRLMDFQLSGVFAKAAPWQEFFVFAPLPAVRELLAAPERVSALRLILKEPRDLDRVQQELTALMERRHPAWTVKNFRETGGFSLGIVQANRFSIMLMDALLLAVTALGISLLLLLSIHLRLPEFRILTLLGTSPVWLLTLLVLESLLLGLTCGLAGVLTGAGLSQYFHHRGLAVSSLPLTYLLGSNLLVPVLRTTGLLKALSLIVGLCLVSALPPLWQSRRLGFRGRMKRKGLARTGKASLGGRRRRPAGTTFVLMICFLLMAGTAGFAEQAAINAEAAVLKYKTVLAPQAFKALLRVELERPERPLRKYTLSLWQKEPGQVRILFEAPATEKGKILYRKKARHFLFLPDLEEVVTLPPSQWSGWSFFYAENLFPFYFEKDLVWKAAPGVDGRWQVTIARPADRQPLAVCTLDAQDGPLSRVVLLDPSGKPRRLVSVAWEYSPAGSRPKSFAVENLEPDPYHARIFIDELQLKPVFPPQAFEIEKSRTGER